MRAFSIVLAAAVGIAIGVAAAWFEPFDNLAIVAPLLAGSAAALALQVGDRWSRLAFLAGALVGWFAGLSGHPGGAAGAASTDVGRAVEATIGMAIAVAVGIAVGVYLRSSGAFLPDHRQKTLVGAMALGGVITVMIGVLFAVRALV